MAAQNVIIIDNIINVDIIHQGKKMDADLKKKADLLIHPIRLQILQTLTNGSLTTQEISDALPSIPKSSIYRHLRLLLTGGMIKVAETRSVRGIQEKVYRLLQAPHLGPEDVAGLTREDHLGYFTTYTATLLQGFADYLDSISKIGGSHRVYRGDNLCKQCRIGRVWFSAQPGDVTPGPQQARSRPAQT